MAISQLRNNPAVRGLFWQAILVLAIGGAVAYLAHNSIVNLQRQSVATGFGFLHREAGFDIGETLIRYNATDSYGRAFLVGLLNTAEVALAGIFLSTIWGTLLGIARLSPNWLLSRLALAYIELVRNIPLLLQLLFLYSVINMVAPPPRAAWRLLPGVFVSNRGLVVPAPLADPVGFWIGVAFLVGIVAAFVVNAWARRRQAATGRLFPALRLGATLIIAAPVLIWLADGAPHALSVPVLRGFNFVGGAAVSPELTALLGGLVIYTSAYIAEIVRAGILAVSPGQAEAAAALGLSRGRILRLIVLPQALRVVIPPLTSQYLNLAKNSTLAVAIGFPDLVFVANTQINQTGQAIEGMAIIMATYLTISLSISALMNFYNARLVSRGRAGMSWARTNLFGSVANTITTLLVAYVAARIAGGFAEWALVHAVWRAPDMRTCHALDTGACWAFIAEKGRFILFGRYPFEQQWRSAAVTAILFLLTGASFVPRLWRPALLYGWIAGIVLSVVLMFGGVLGLPYVPTDLWGGLPLTVILSLFSMILAFPLAILLALGRRSDLPVIRLICIGAIEFMRGVPLIAMLYMASLMLPLFLPPGVTIDKELRALIGITLFLAAYQAEDIRAGLQALPRGQFEAADALGFGYWRKMRLIVLPQAITTVIPPLVSNLIGTFKNTSLVSIIGLYDLLETAKLSLVDPDWRGLTSEAYIFIAAIYFIVCFGMSRYSQWLERRLDRTRQV